MLNVIVIEENLYDRQYVEANVTEGFDAFSKRTFKDFTPGGDGSRYLRHRRGAPSGTVARTYATAERAHHLLGHGHLAAACMALTTRAA